VSDGKLVFIRPQDGTGRLVFNDDSVATVPDVNIGVDATFTGETADMPATVQLLWDAGVSRGEAIETRIHWQDAQIITTRTGTRWQTGQTVAARTAAHWQDSQPLNSRTGTRWQDAEAQRHAAAVVWQEAQRLRGSVAARWQDAQAQRAVLLARWQEAIRLRNVAAVRWQGTGSAQALRHQVLHSSGAALPTGHRIAAHWQDARRPPAGLSVVVQPQPPEQEPCYDPATLGRLEFVAPLVAGDGRLVFICVRGQVGPSAPLYILPARYYMTVHSLQAHRLPDLTEIPIFDVSLGADPGSFGWTFQASAPVSAFDALAPSSGLPTSIRITLDGLQFVFIVDSLQHDEAFGRRSVRLAGRSATALQASPTARETSRLNTSARTAQQLALEALEFTGLALDWGITDWLVPAGAWSHTGTPLAAVQAIVEEAGGYLQSHRTAATLLARHPYPDFPGGLTGGPWNWYEADVVPDVELAPDAIVTTAIERRDGADINAVWVSGTTQGVLAQYKRSGTAGDKLAAPVTGALITAAEVARWRGRSIVGASGPKHLVQLSMPVLTGVGQPGILDVGQLVQINTSTPWRGRVRSVSASAAFGKEVRQTVQIERHLLTT